MAEENLKVLLGALSAQSAQMRTSPRSIVNDFIDRTVVEQPVETPTEEPPVGSEDWVISLNSISGDNVLQISEYDQTYLYKRVKDPAGEETKKFLVFYKESDSDWEILTGLLSNRYHIASLEKFVNVLLSRIDIQENRILYKEPFRLEWRGKTNFTINTFEDEATKLIFGITSGLDLGSIESIENMNAGLTLLVSNSYDGSRSLRIDHTINLKGSIAEKEIEFVDYFTLCNYSNHVIHNSSLINIAEDLESVASNTEANIARLKAATEGIDELALNISRFYSKDIRDQFNSIMENIVPEFKNMYILFMIASIFLSKDYSILRHQKIRGVLDGASRRLLTAV
jgi:hypothetical protein